MKTLTQKGPQNRISPSPLHFWELIQNGSKGLWILIGCTVLWKIVLLFLAFDKAPNTDGILYVRAAQEWAAGHFRQAIKIYPMPAYPALIALVHGIVPDWVLAGRILSCLFLTLCLVPLYRITERWFGPASAFWAGLAFTIQPFGNEMSTLVYRGAPYLFFFGTAVWMFLNVLDDPSIKKTAAAFGLSLLPMLFRIEGAFLVPLFPATLLLLGLWNRRFRGGVTAAAAVWILFLGGALWAAWFWAPPETMLFNRMAQLQEAVRQFWHMEFLKQYMKIYNHLKAMEALSPLPTQNQNFGEIARHFLWLIYFIGLVQTIGRTLDPAFLLPLAVGVKKGEKRPSQLFVLAALVVYMMILYVQLIQHDFTGRRFVWACTFLLYPWVGRGLALIWDWTRLQRWKPVLASGFVLCFIGVPLSHFSGVFEKPDRVAMEAGRWLASTPCKDLFVLGNDYRIPFAAGIYFDYENREDAPYWHFDPESKDYSNVEQLALALHRDLIVLKFPNKKSVRIPSFSQYRLVRSFQGKRRTVYIFGTDQAVETCAGAPSSFPSESE